MGYPTAIVIAAVIPATASLAGIYLNYVLSRNHRERIEKKIDELGSGGS